MLILSFVRLFAFKLFESPRYLLGHGRDAEAVAVVRQIAEYNGLGSGDTESNRGRISVEELNEAAKAVEDKMERQGKGGEVGEWRRWRVLSEESSWKMAHVRNLFGTRKMAWSTSLLIALWGASSYVAVSFALTHRVSYGQVLLGSHRRCITVSYLTCKSKSLVSSQG